MKHPRETSRKSLSDSYQEASLYNSKSIAKKYQQSLPVHEMYDFQLACLGKCPSPW